MGIPSVLYDRLAGGRCVSLEPPIPDKPKNENQRYCVTSPGQEYLGQEDLRHEG